MKLVSVSDPALFKVLLHATKHPTSAVNGLLLGTVETTAPGASPPTSPRAAGGGGAGAVRVTVTDAIPVCHSFITLTPVLEVALSQVDVYVKAQQQQQQQPGLRVVGYYQANERMADADLGAAGRRIADRVEALGAAAAAAPSSGGGSSGGSGSSVALVLDSVVLDAAIKGLQSGAAATAVPPLKPVLQLFCKDGQRGWTQAASAALRCSPAEDVAARLTQYASEGRHLELADWEDHLEDVSAATADWLNPGLLAGPA